MKKDIKILVAISSVLLLVFVIFSSSAILPQTGKTTVVNNPFPDSINVILKKSCTPCHSGGNPGASSKLDITKWTEYSLKEQMDKGAVLCDELTSGGMPPRSVRQSKPEMVPTEAQIAMVCKWIAGLIKEKR
jgi:hypothetical protein